MDIQELINMYDLWTVVLAFIAIILIGVIKIIFKNPLSNLPKQKAKPIYETLTIVFALLLSIVWLLIKGPWCGQESVTLSISLIAGQAALVFAVVNVIYPFYENYGLRTLLQKIGEFILDKFSKKTDDSNDKELKV